jgi:ketosteroid isomerase-like protein
MKHFLFAILAMAAGIPVAPAFADAVTDIGTVESTLERALKQRDRAALEPLIANPFTWVHASDGRVESREVWLANAAKGMALTGQRTVRTEYGVSLDLHGSPNAHTAVRVTRVRLVDAPDNRESWLRQTHVWVRDAGGAWKLAIGQGALMYEGPMLDLALHQRYAGTYVISPDRKLVLAWEDDALLATLPNGTKAQIFLASPTEEVTRTMGGGRFRFTLGEDGLPVSVALVRADKEVWRASRVSSGAAE